MELKKEDWAKKGVGGGAPTQQQELKSGKETSSQKEYEAEG